MFRIYRVSRKGDRLLLSKTDCPRAARRMLDAHDNPWTALVVYGPDGEISESALEQHLASGLDADQQIAALAIVGTVLDEESATS